MRRQLRPDAVAYTGFVDACAAAGDASSAIAWLQRMRAEALQPDAVAHSGVVRACAAAARWQEAASWLDAMAASSLAPSPRALAASVRQAPPLVAEGIFRRAVAGHPALGEDAGVARAVADAAGRGRSRELRSEMGLRQAVCGPRGEPARQTDAASS